MPPGRAPSPPREGEPPESFLLDPNTIGPDPNNPGRLGGSSCVCQVLQIGPGIRFLNSGPRGVVLRRAVENGKVDPIVKTTFREI